MADSPRSLIHAVFSTKDSRSNIPRYLIESLWSACGAIAKQNEMKALVVGGSSNHIHILLSVPDSMDLASAVEMMKERSAAYLNEHMSGAFEWQDGYGAFTVKLPEATESSVKGYFLAKNGMVLDSKSCVKTNT
jgi:REP-associated tyrosine transposase